MAQKHSFKNINGKAIKEAAKSAGGFSLFDDGEKQKPEQKPTYNGDITKKESFFPAVNLDPERATRLYPYRLLVIDATNNNIISNSSPGQKGTKRADDFYLNYNEDTGGVNFKLEPNNKNVWEFILPITPQQLSVTNQFAINTTATMRGVVEEHNGIKFKIIQASGTTGIWPERQSTFSDDRAGKGNDLFGGTVAAVDAFKNAAKDLKNAIKGDKDDPESLTDEASKNKSTGYFQAMLLQQFLEQYAMAKKNPKNKHWRLVFDCPKTNESFIVTPMQYTVTKSQRSPGEHLYNMQFKAWKRVDLKAVKPKKVARFLDLEEGSDVEPSAFQKLNNSLDNARSLMSAGLNVVKAVRSDFRKVFDTFRKVTLFVKDLGGVGKAISDLPNQIAKDITSATKKRSRDLARAAGRGAIAGGEVRSRVAQDKINKTTSLIVSEGDNNEGLGDDDVESGENGTGARDARRTSPLNNVFDEPEANFDFFNSISIDELDLTPQQTAAIQDEIENNSLLSIEEIKEFTKETRDFTDDVTNNYGAGDEFFSEVFGKPAPKKRATPMTIEEFELVKALEDVILDMNLLVATRQLDDIRTQSSLEYVGGLAEESGIEFDSSTTAKYLAPVPFGLTIEEISARYLGDPDRYNEIITLNNLRSPYIDEDGFFYELLSNGDGRQFNIEDNQNLFVGQKIQISSNTIPMFTRKITAIEKITDDNYLITVDGLSNLSNLTTNDNAKIKAFLPGTVNSQNQIYIPSDQAVDEEPRTFDIPFLKGDDLTSLSKVDWLLDDNGDVVLNSFGEAALANGLNNLIQALKMKISTQKGTLLADENFGLGLVPGVNVTNVNIETVLSDLRAMVLQDSRFEAVDKIEVNLLGSDLSITIQARLANGRGIFPINFSV